MKISRKQSTLILLLISTLLISSCAQVITIDACVADTTYGFWHGLWHGIIAPASFVLSLFMDDVALYAVNNTGGWYDFGFVVGAGILFGGGGSRARR